MFQAVPDTRDDAPQIRRTPEYLPSVGYALGEQVARKNRFTHYGHIAKRGKVSAGSSNGQLAH